MLARHQYIIIKFSNGKSNHYHFNVKKVSFVIC